MIWVVWISLGLNLVSVGLLIQILRSQAIIRRKLNAIRQILERSTLVS